MTPISPGEGGRRDWARERLAGRIDEEVAALEAHRATLDLESVAQDRAGAASMALFDTSREASLARRYESEARRGFFRAMEESRRVEAEAAEAERASAEPLVLVEPSKPLGAEAAARLGSLGEGPSREAREPIAAPPEGPPRWPVAAGGMARGLDGRVVAVGRAFVGA